MSNISMQFETEIRSETVEFKLIKETKAIKALELRPTDYLEQRFTAFVEKCI